MGPSGFKKRAKKNGEMPASMDSILITRFGEGVAVGQTEELQVTEGDIITEKINKTTISRVKPPHHNHNLSSILKPQSKKKRKSTKKLSVNPSKEEIFSDLNKQQNSRNNQRHLVTPDIYQTSEAINALKVNAGPSFSQDQNKQFSTTNRTSNLCGVTTTGETPRRFSSNSQTAKANLQNAGKKQDNPKNQSQLREARNLLLLNPLKGIYYDVPEELNESGNPRKDRISSLFDDDQSFQKQLLIPYNYQMGKNNGGLNNKQTRKSAVSAAALQKFDEEKILGWPQLPPSFIQQQSDQHILSKNQYLHFQSNSPPFYMINQTAKGTSEGIDPVNIANNSDSDESLKLPKLPNWRLSSVKSQAKLFNSIMPGHSKNIQNIAYNFRTGVSPSENTALTSTKNLSLPPLKNQIYGFMMDSSQNASSNSKLPNLINQPLSNKNSKKQQAHNLKQTQLISKYLGNNSSNKMIAQAAASAAGIEKILKNHNSPIIQQQKIVQPMQNFKSAKNIIKNGGSFLIGEIKENQEELLSEIVAKKNKGQILIDKESSQSKSSKRMTLEPHVKNQAKPTLNVQDQFYKSQILDKNTTPTPTTNYQFTIQNNQKQPQQIQSLYQSPIVSNTDQENIQNQIPSPFNQRDLFSSEQEDRKFEDLQYFPDSNPTRNSKLDIKREIENINQSINYTLQLANASINKKIESNSPIVIHKNERVLLNSNQENVIQETSQLLFNANQRQNKIEQSQNQNGNLEQTGASQTHPQNIQNNLNSNLTEVGSYKTALLLAKLSQIKHVKVNFPDTILVNSSLDVHSLFEVLYLAHQGTKLESYQIEPQRDIDSIFTSWLNMNMAKSQSGCYVPISISKFQNFQSSINSKKDEKLFDFFVVTAKQNFETQFHKVQQTPEDCGFMIQRYVPSRGSGVSTIRAIWNHDRGIKFYIFNNRYTFNGQVFSISGDQSGSDRKYLRGKKFLNFQKLAKLYKNVSQINPSLMQQTLGSTVGTEVTVDKVAFKSQQHLLLQHEIYNQYSSIEQQFKVNIPKDSGQADISNSNIGLQPMKHEDFIKTKLKPDMPRFDLNYIATIQEETKQGLNFRPILKAISKIMSELIHILSNNREILQMIGGKFGQVRKLTADFIEDYQSEPENLQILLQRIVSYEVIPEQKFQNPEVIDISSIAVPIATQNVEPLEQVKQDNSNKKLSNSPKQFKCLGDYCFIKKSSHIPRHLAPVITDLMAKKKDHLRVSLHFIEEDRKLLKLIQEEGGDYESALINKVQSSQPTNLKIEERESILTTQKNTLAPSNINQDVHQKEPLSYGKDINQDFKEQNIGISPRYLDHDQQVEVCTICYSIYNFLDNLRKNLINQTVTYENKMLQTSDQTPNFITIKDENKGIQTLDDGNGPASILFKTTTIDINTRSDPMATHKNPDSNDPLPDEDDFDDTRVISQQQSMKKDEEQQPVIEYVKKESKVVNQVVTNQVIDSVLNKSYTNQFSSNEELLIEQDSTYQQPQIFVMDQNPRFSTSNPRASIRYSQGKKKNGCIIQTFQIADIVPSVEERKTFLKTIDNDLPIWATDHMAITKNEKEEQIDREEILLIEQKRESSQSQYKNLNDHKEAIKALIKEEEIEILQMKRRSLEGFVVPKYKEEEQLIEDSVVINSKNSQLPRMPYPFSQSGGNQSQYQVVEKIIEIKVDGSIPAGSINIMKSYEAENTIPKLTTESPKPNPKRLHNLSETNLKKILFNDGPNTSMKEQELQKSSNGLLKSSFMSLNNQQELRNSHSSMTKSLKRVQFNPDSFIDRQSMKSHISFDPLDEVIMPKTPPDLTKKFNWQVSNNNLLTITRKDSQSGHTTFIPSNQEQVYFQPSSTSELRNSLVDGKVFQYRVQTAGNDQSVDHPLETLKNANQNVVVLDMPPHMRDSFMQGRSMSASAGAPKTITIKSESKDLDSFFGRISQQDEEYLVEYIASLNEDSFAMGASQSGKSSRDTPFQSVNGGIVLVLSKQGQNAQSD